LPQSVDAFVAQNPAYAPPAYHDPRQGGAPAGNGNYGGYPAQGYAPQSPFPVPQQPSPYPDAYPNDGGYAQPQGNPGYQGHGYDDGYANGSYAQPGYGAHQGGYEQWQGQPAHPPADPRAAYDLANFAARGAPPPPGRSEFGLRAPPAEAQDWQNNAADGYGYRQDDGYGYADDQHVGHEQAGGQHAYDEFAEEVEAEEGRSGRRGLMIVGVLVGAIALGGGLAYGYKQFTGKSAGRPPVVKAEAGPTKLKPLDQGGKEFAHTDKKLMERLDESRVAAAGGAIPLAPQERFGEKDENGALKVRTIPIGRDGTLAPPPPAPQQQAPAIPGLVLDGSLSQRAPPMPQPSAPEPRVDSRPAMPAASGPSGAPVQPRRVATTNSAAPPAEPIAQAPPPVSSKAARKAPSREAAVASAAAVPSSPPPTANRSGVGAGGYVAIVASQKSRIEALKAFADLQQKYAGVLQGKTPDVQEADLGAKGHWFRAVVGPPGSREAASGVCSQLKTAGYGGCWVGTY